jgi:hypothetical protein
VEEGHARALVAAVVPVSERQYVPHAVTGEPVPVLTPEEQAAQMAEKQNNPAVFISGVRCWCGAEEDLGKRRGWWMWSGDGVQINCSAGHRNLVRFLPETVS